MPNQSDLFVVDKKMTDLFPYVTTNGTNIQYCTKKIHPNQFIHNRKSTSKEKPHDILIFLFFMKIV